MATGGYPVSGGKKEAICTGCNKKNKTLKAVKYCVQCQVYCCQSCVDMHEMFPPLAGHSFLDVGQENKSDLTCKSEYNMSQHEGTFEEEFSNWAKAVLGLQKARDGSINYVRSKIQPYVDTLCKRHKSNEGEHFKDLLIQVTVYGYVKKKHLHKKDGTKIRWVLDGIKCKTCDKIFKEQLDMFVERWCPCKNWISNSRIEQVEPTSYWWIIAKMYVAKPEIIDAVGPETVEPLAIFNLIKHCKLFDSKLRSDVDVLVQLRHRLMHSANDRLTRKEMNNIFDTIKEFLKQVSANPTEINEVEMLEKRTVFLYDENGELSELAKEALRQQDKSLNADLKAPEGIRAADIKSLITSNIEIKEQKMKLVESEKKHNKKMEDLIKQNEDLQRKYEESEKKVHLYESLPGMHDELVNKKKTDVYKVKSSRDINIKVSDDINKCSPLGCCLTPDNQLLVTDTGNLKVKRIDTSTRTIVDSCEVASLPLGIVCISNLEVAVVCKYPNKIQFVSIGDVMKPSRKIQTSHECYGIAMKDDYLYVTDWNTSLYVYDMNGTLLRTIINDNDGNELFSIIRHIAFNACGDKMFVCDMIKGIVCFDGECNHLYTIKDNALDGAIDVCTDGAGSVFVIDSKLNNVVQFSEDGKKIGVVVKQGDDPNKPISISFHQGHHRMYVAMYDNDIIKMYELE